MYGDQFGELVCGYWGSIFKAVKLRSIYYSSITVFHGISKQIQQRARVGKIFARWHLAIAITSNYRKQVWIQGY